MLPPVVLWIDPGLVTGLAWLSNRGQNFVAHECGFMEAATRIEYSCQVFNQELWIGWERFTVHPHTPPIDAHHAIEMIGVTRLFAQRYACRILSPAQQATPKPFEQRQLKQLGWWLP